MTNGVLLPSQGREQFLVNAAEPAVAEDDDDIAVAGFFFEAGDAFDGLRTRRLHPAAGGELRWALSVGHLGGTVRLGYGYGFDQAEGGGHRAYLGVGAGF